MRAEAAEGAERDGLMQFHPAEAARALGAIVNMPPRPRGPNFMDDSTSNFESAAFPVYEPLQVDNPPSSRSPCELSGAAPASVKAPLTQRVIKLQDSKWA